MSAGSGRAPHAAATIFRKEVRELLRDRRAVFFALVLPLVLYPVLFLVLTVLPRAQREDLASRELRVGVSGPVEELLRSLREEDHLVLVPGVFREQDVRAGDPPLFVEIEPATDEGPIRVQAHYLPSTAASGEALRRVEAVIARWRERILEQRFAERGLPLDVRGLLTIHDLDVSTPEERSAAGFGRLAPFLLILLLLTGGSFASIDLLAGEKERGTLETLCVQAVSTSDIVLGKFLIVLVASILSVLLNLGGLYVAGLVGLAPRLPDGSDLILPGPLLLGTILLLLVPMAVLTSSVLLAASAWSRSYREAQTWLLPVTLLALLPLALAASPHVRLSSVVALVPVANVALAIREAIAARLDPVAALVVLVSTTAWATVALRYAARLLSREEVILGLEPPTLASDVDAASRERRAIGVGAAEILLLWFAAPWLQNGQTVSFPVGLAITLWGVVLLPAILWPLLAGRPLRAALALRRPRGGDLALAALGAMAAALVITAYMELQQQVLPMPESLEREFARIFSLEEIHPVLAFLLFALSPGICEELFWRGAVQGELEARARPVRAVVWSGLLFGTFHLSLHRFLPTAMAGLALATLRLRTGSIVVPALFHTVFNATTLFLLPRWLAGDASGPGLLERPGLVVLAALLLAACLLLCGRGAARKSSRHCGE